ncbi:MAG: hypothetical protein HOK84_18380 [Bacteroidetes bacterium]|nr:hypothetical protein [Bacteroidota bacterium]
MRSLKRIIPISIIILAALTSATIINKKEDQNKQYQYFENPMKCSGCHWDRFDRWNTSQHSKGFTGDFFQAQYFDMVLPSMGFDDKVASANEDCIGCHSPSAFLSGDRLPERSLETDNHWNRGDGNKTRADRGIFCDFCHTLDRFRNDPAFNHDYISHATEEVDAKRADLEFAWSPYHESQTTEMFEDANICATCHNELNPYDVWVKATEHEYQESVYPSRGILCQTCHMQPMAGKPAKMGFQRKLNHDHWFGGGFAEFVEGAAGVYFQNEFEQVPAGEEIDFSIMVKALATGHNFPTGSVEERDVWLHVSLNNAKGEEVLHIPVPLNPSDPNDKYFITSNEKIAYPNHSELSEAIERDGLTEGDRIYHSVFLDSKGEYTYAQWFCVEEIENRLRPLEERMENYTLRIPENLPDGQYTLIAVLYYRRMPDPHADFLKLERRPVIEVSRDVRGLTVH